jgi:predicted nucleic acid-binding protein
MTVYLPDTNILIDALNAKRGRKEMLRDLLLQGHRLACCAVTVAEVCSGMQAQESRITEQFLSALVWYETSRAVAWRAGRLRFDWVRKGATLALPDTLIAATALEYGLTIITNNDKHFPMPDLKLYSLS